MRAARTAAARNRTAVSLLGEAMARTPTARGLALAAVTVLALSAAPAAAAKSYAPGKNKAYHGVSDTGDVEDFFSFADQVEAHPATLQMFFHWGVPLKSSGALHRWTATDTRGVLHLSTLRGDGVEVITPKEIAKGRGDPYILRLRESIAHSGQTVYIRLMGEMNGHFNPYSAYNANGSRRPGHGTRWFKKAWRRFSIIVHGGDRRRLNERLRKQGLPRILRADSQGDPVYEDFDVPEILGQPRVALMWTPLSFGSPNIRAQRPQAYWPGRKYVDWVGTDIYSKFAGAFDDLKRFYVKLRRKYHKPFVIGEYSPWDNDRDGSFVRKLYRWAKKNKKVKMLLYYRSNGTENPHNLQHYPGARRALQRIHNKPRYRQHAPGVTEIPDEPPPEPEPPDEP